MFNKPVSQLTEEDIQSLVDNKERESSVLEFKQEISGTDREKKEIAKDVSAMANAEGGYFIVGIKENDSQVPGYYLISFANYNKKICEINLLTSNKARKAIELFKEIGTKICCEEDFKKYNIDRLPVYNSGDYKKLYRGLSADIELKEIKLQEDARIFYFDIEAQRTLYIVAITQNHLETDKVRR